MSKDTHRHGWRDWVTMIAAIISALGWMGTAVWQGAHEQSQWERDARQAAYANFYGALQTEHDRRMRCETGSREPEPQMKEINQAMLGIEMFGSSETLLAARDARHVVNNMECSAPLDFGAKLKTVPRIGELVRSMRQDLGITE